MVKENIQNGSWMWKKILKSREKAKQFYCVEVRNGRKTAFWHKKWCSLGCLIDILRESSCIDMGIPLNATVADSMKHRRRSHRVQLLNRVEMEIERVKESRGAEDDVSKWKNSKGKYKTKFSTKETWLSIRKDHPL